MTGARGAAAAAARKRGAAAGSYGECATTGAAPCAIARASSSLLPSSMALKKPESSGAGGGCSRGAPVGGGCVSGCEPGTLQTAGVAARRAAVGAAASPQQARHAGPAARRTAAEDHEAARRREATKRHARQQRDGDACRNGQRLLQHGGCGPAPCRERGVQPGRWARMPRPRRAVAGAPTRPPAASRALDVTVGPFSRMHAPVSAVWATGGPYEGDAGARSPPGRAAGPIMLRGRPGRGIITYAASRTWPGPRRAASRLARGADLGCLCGWDRRVRKALSNPEARVGGGSRGACVRVAASPGGRHTTGTRRCAPFGPPARVWQCLVLLVEMFISWGSPP